MDFASKEESNKIDADDTRRFFKKVTELKSVSKDFSALLETYVNFRLQLIAIAGATFSIYIALHSNSTPPDIYTKSGFIALAISLLFGVLSIVASFAQKAFRIFFAIFDFDKSAETETEGFKSAMHLMGMDQGTYYDKSFKKLEDSNHGKTVLQWLRYFLITTIGGYSIWLGVGQIVAFLFATALLLFGLLRI